MFPLFISFCKISYSNFQTVLSIFTTWNSLDCSRYLSLHFTLIFFNSLYFFKFKKKEQIYFSEKEDKQYFIYPQLYKPCSKSRATGPHPILQFPFPLLSSNCPFPSPLFTLLPPLPSHSPLSTLHPPLWKVCPKDWTNLLQPQSLTSFQGQSCWKLRMNLMCRYGYKQKAGIEGNKMQQGWGQGDTIWGPNCNLGAKLQSGTKSFQWKQVWLGLRCECIGLIWVLTESYKQVVFSIENQVVLRQCTSQIKIQNQMGTDRTESMEGIRNKESGFK